MKPAIFCALLVVISAGGFSSVKAQTNNSSVSTTLAMDQGKKTLEKYVKPILAVLSLNDVDKEAKVRAILAKQIKAFEAWHTQHDLQIKELWNDFDQARSKQDEANANAALAKIDGVYASFKPEHQKFESDLLSVLTPDQVEAVKDEITINKVKVTYNAYQEIFHGLTDEQKAFILKDLKAAREEAIDANAMTEKSAFFKKYKIKIETYLTSQGYDVKQSYREFVAKQKAEDAAKKAAALTDDQK